MYDDYAKTLAGKMVPVLYSWRRGW